MVRRNSGALEIFFQIENFTFQRKKLLLGVLWGETNHFSGKMKGEHGGQMQTECEVT